MKGKGKGSIVLEMAADNLILLSSGYNSTFDAFTKIRELSALIVVRHIPPAVFGTIPWYIVDRLGAKIQLYTGKALSSVPHTFWSKTIYSSHAT